MNARQRLVPNPQWRKVVRSKCHYSGVTRQMGWIAVEVLGANASALKWGWTGIWLCNACLKPCDIYHERVRNYSKSVRVGRFECADLVESLNPQPYRQVHDIDNTAKTCSCGSPCGIQHTDYRTEHWYTRYRASKRATFHQCVSKFWAQVLGCPHAIECRYTGFAIKDWAINKEMNEDITRHFSKCPAVVNPPQTVKSRGYTVKVDLKKAREEGEAKVKELLADLFQTSGEGLPDLNI